MTGAALTSGDQLVLFAIIVGCLWLMLISLRWSLGRRGSWNVRPKAPRVKRIAISYRGQLRVDVAGDVLQSLARFHGSNPNEFTSTHGDVEVVVQFEDEHGKK